MVIKAVIDEFLKQKLSHLGAAHVAVLVVFLFYIEQKLEQWNRISFIKLGNKRHLSHPFP